MLSPKLKPQSWTNSTNSIPSVSAQNHFKKWHTNWLTGFLFCRMSIHYILNWNKLKPFYFSIFYLFFPLCFLSTLTCPEDELNTKPDERAAGAQHLPTWGWPFEGPLEESRGLARWWFQALQSLDQVQHESPDLIYSSCISEMPRDYAESFPECDHVRQETWSHCPKAQGETRLSQKVPARLGAAFCSAAGSTTDPG